jgi:hypothetical protein
MKHRDGTICHICHIGRVCSVCRLGQQISRVSSSVVLVDLAQRWGTVSVCSEGVPGSECFSTLGFGFQTHSGTDVNLDIYTH